jgi:hypothetical protein
MLLGFKFGSIGKYFSYIFHEVMRAKDGGIFFVKADYCTAYQELFILLKLMHKFPLS